MSKYDAEMGSVGNFAVVIIWKVEYNVCTFVRDAAYSMQFSEEKKIHLPGREALSHNLTGETAKQ